MNEALPQIFKFKGAKTDQEDASQSKMDEEPIISPIKSKVDSLLNMIQLLIMILGSEIHPELIKNVNNLADDLKYIKIELGWL